MYTIIFDWKRTLYDPDSKMLIEGTLQLLKFLKQKNTELILIGKGGDDMNQEVKRLKIQEYFSEVIFQEGKKDKTIFDAFVSKKNPQSTIIIGDRVRSELEIGNLLKTITIWVRQGKFSEEKPLNEVQEPSFTVASILELLEYFQKKFKWQIFA